MTELFTNVTDSVSGRMLLTFLISMVPVVELRGGLPFGITQGLQLPQALCASILGNMVPVPFIIVYIRKVFAWLRKKSLWWDDKVSRLERRAHLKGAMVTKYSVVGLCLLVAIPLPGTGAWTGALAAAFLDLRLKRAVPTIFLGVCIAAAIMTLVTYGATMVFN